MRQPGAVPARRGRGPRRSGGVARFTARSEHPAVHDRRSGARCRPSPQGLPGARRGRARWDPRPCGPASPQGAEPAGM